MSPTRSYRPDTGEGDRDRATRVRDLFDSALDLGPEQRAAFLDDACGADRALRAEVEGLLRALASAHTADLLPGMEQPRAPTGGTNPRGATAGGAKPNGMSGRLVANYRIEEELASGGMGVVYRAQHVLLQRRAAVKVLHDHLGSDAGLVQRLLNEARAVNAIRHPHIVELLDAGLLDGDGAPYVVMELLDGESLGARLHRAGALPVRDAATIGLEIAAALAVAHDHSIVHRDLKPENVFLARRPEGGSGPATTVKVLDFGIAKLRGDIAIAPAATQEGGFLGTPQYMAPEQWRDARSGDRRIDIYALGLILFEMVAGEPPFRGAVWSELFEMHVSQPPPRLRERALDAPAALEAVVAQALAKNPEQRFPSMRAIAAALAAAVPEARVPAGLFPDPAVEADPATAPTLAARDSAGIIVDAKPTGTATQRVVSGSAATGAADPPVPATSSGKKWAALIGGALAAGAIGVAALTWLRTPGTTVTPIDPPAKTATTTATTTAPATAAPRAVPERVAPAPTATVPRPEPPAAAPAAAAPRTGEDAAHSSAAASAHRRGPRHAPRNQTDESPAPATPSDNDGVPGFLKQNPYK